MVKTKRSQRATLAGYLEASKTSQVAFARELGISESFVSEILSGHKFPGRRLALRIADTYGIPLASLLGQNKKAA